MSPVLVSGVPLHEFQHPERAVYILGAEDAGLPASVVRACAHCVSLEGVRASSYNVAVAATLIMYDRCIKLGSRPLMPIQLQCGHAEAVAEAAQDCVAEAEQDCVAEAAQVSGEERLADEVEGDPMQSAACPAVAEDEKGGPDYCGQ